MHVFSQRAICAQSPSRASDPKVEMHDACTLHAAHTHTHTSLQAVADCWSCRMKNGAHPKHKWRHTWIPVEPFLALDSRHFDLFSRNQNVVSTIGLRGCRLSLSRRSIRAMAHTQSLESEAKTHVHTTTRALADCFGFYRMKYGD